MALMWAIIQRPEDKPQTHRRQADRLDVAAEFKVGKKTQTQELKMVNQWELSIKEWTSIYDGKCTLITCILLCP